MDYLDRLKEHIEGLNTFKDTIDIGLLSDGESICLRLAPSAPPLKYLDKGNLYNFNFQVLVRHSSQITAYKTMQLIASDLDKLERGEMVSLDDSFKFMKCRTQSMPSFLERDGSGWIYTVLFSSEIYIN